jgi:hypothetical protein
MATRHIDINNYCECLYSELSNIKDSLDAFLTQINLMEGKDKGHFHTHAKHLNELIKNVDWKMEIFAKECPVDWSKFGKDVESSTSVPTSESLKEKDFPSAGYAGG